MGESWTEYGEVDELRCTYCGCTKEDEYYIGGDCECGRGAGVFRECSGGVELEGFNNIDMVLEGKR